MKTITILFLALGAIAAGAQTTSQSQIRHIETSLNHLTVLEFGESVTTLAIADPDSFQVERHDDKVFVKPLREGVSTNLFVWTASRELSYELDPAGQLAHMDVLVRTEPAPNPHSSAQAVGRTVRCRDSQDRFAGSYAGNDGSRRHRARRGKTRHGARAGRSRTGLSREGSDLYSLFGSQRDQGSVPGHDTGCVRPCPDRAAYLAREPQESSDHVSDLQAFKAKQVSGIEVMQAESGTRDLAPGEKTTGVISIGTSTGNPPQIYQLNFGADQNGPLKVEAVL